ncbi:MAG: two-component system response regulator AtoC [Verrucomicrobiales bacterium]|jgi:two-component system response regulator AtoC
MDNEFEIRAPEATILIVDDEKNTRDGLRKSFEDDFDVYVAADISGALQILKSDDIDLMVTDLRLGGENGMDLIEHALKLPKPPISIMMTAYGSVDTAVEAMKRGAYEYVTKPLNIDELEILIKRALRSQHLEKEVVQLKQQVETRFSVSNIIGKAPAMQPVFDMIKQVAPSRATVLIQGENGSGKELVAKAIHNLSGRPKARLVSVHCAGLNREVMESELFGHVKGAYTDAHKDRAGYFEEANGGTLFLDEIGEIDGPTQVKLLRALGERVIQKVGSTKPMEVDVRLVTATNKDLEKMVAEGSFREDLFYRLNVITITMPPLRVRKEDIVLLADAFLHEFAKENAKPFRELTSEALSCLLEYQWPGNVRELRTAIEHGVVLSSGPKITVRHLPQRIREHSRGPDSSSGSVPAAAGLNPDVSDLNIAAMEERFIRLALQRTNNHRTEAADLLGMSRRTLQRRLKEMGLYGDSDD